MTEKKKDDEATQEVNAPEPTKPEKSSSEPENLEDSKTKVEPEEIAEDYLEEEPKETVDYKKRYGDSTREFQEFKKKTDAQTQAVEQLEKLAKLNPKIVAEIEAAQKLSGGDSTLVKQQIDEALEPVKKMTQELQNKDKLEKVKVLAKFEKKNPDLFSPKATAEEKKKVRQQIGKVANALVESGMSYSRAVERAHLTVNPKAAIQKGKDEAYLEGLDEKQAGFSGQASTEGRKPTKTSYSKRELEIGDKMGVGKLMRKDKS